jgi:hypothetical protein
MDMEGTPNRPEEVTEMKIRHCGSISTNPVTPKHGGRDYKVTAFECGKCGVKRRARSYQHARALWGAHQSALPFLSHGMFLSAKDIEAVTPIEEG